MQLSWLCLYPKSYTCDDVGYSEILFHDFKKINRFILNFLKFFFISIDDLSARHQGPRSLQTRRTLENMKIKKLELDAVVFCDGRRQEMWECFLAISNSRNRLTLFLPLSQIISGWHKQEIGMAQHIRHRKRNSNSESWNPQDPLSWL